MVRLHRRGEVCEVVFVVGSPGGRLPVKDPPRIVISPKRTVIMLDYDETDSSRLTLDSRRTPFQLRLYVSPDQPIDHKCMKTEVLLGLWYSGSGPWT